MKRSRLSIMLCAILIIAALLAACGRPAEPASKLVYRLAYAASYDENTVPFDVNLGEMDPASTKKVVKLMRSFKELTDESAENGYPFFNEEDENYDSEISKKMREYDGGYFEDKAILLLIMFENPYDRSTFDKLSVNGDALIVTLSKDARDYECDLPALVEARVYVFELFKTDMEGIEEIRIDIVENAAG